MILHCCFAAMAAAQQNAGYLQLGKQELGNGHFTKAIEYFNLSIAQQPQSLDSYFYRALAKEELDDYIGAEEDYSKAIALYSSWTDVYISRAHVRNRMFDYKGEFEDYEKAIALDSTNPVIYFNRAITLLSLKRYGEAISDCNHAKRLKYNNENLYLVSGGAKAGLANYNGAIADYNYAISKNKKNTYAYLHRAEAMIALQKKDSALYDLNYILKLDSLNTEALMSRALLEMEDEKNADALKDLNKIIRLSDDNTSAYFNRALLKAKLSDYKGALADYDKVTALQPENILAYYNRAGLKYNHKDLKGALEDYDKVIGLFPDFSDAYYYRSLVKKGLNRPEESKTDLNRSKEIHASFDTLSDAKKLEMESRLMKLLAFNGRFEDDKNDKEKIQFENIDVEMKPIFSVNLFPAQKQFRLYKVQPGNDKSVIALSNSADTVDMESVFSKINALNLIISKDSSDAISYADRADLYSAVNRYTLSIADYSKSLLLDSSNVLTWFSRANARYNLLELLYAFDRQVAQSTNPALPYKKKIYEGLTYELILADYSKALKLSPDFAYAWFNSATIKTKLEDYAGAIADYSKALSYDGTLSEVYYNRGLLYIILKDNVNACRDLSKAGEQGITEAYSVMRRFCYK